MRRFFCDCGQELFFDSGRCVRCDAPVGFDPEAMTMRRLADASLLCDNGSRYGVCNWLRAGSTHSTGLCRACNFNRTIPNLQHPENLRRWKALEGAKKRLLYTLITLGLPLVDGHTQPGRGLLFDFVEDGRSNSDYAYPEANTGHRGGVITVNIVEADSVAREIQREALNEPHRTLLGHLRHESGHYAFEGLLDPAANPEWLASFRSLFGDERADYSAALAAHYATGPPADWPQRCISAYAAAHPAEDWAETWGHFLHMFDVLDTACAHGVLAEAPADFEQRIAAWRQLSTTLNELNRSLGLGDAYPFVLSSLVEEKLSFVASSINRVAQAAPATL